MNADPRDQRAAQILTAPIRVQAWFQMPERDWPLISFFGQDVVQTTIELDESVGGRTALLVEFNSCDQALEPWHELDVARLRTIAARLRFAWAGLPQIIAARLIETGKGAGEKIRIRICNPAVFGGQRGSTMPRVAPDAGALASNQLLEAPLPPEVDRALHWYLAGVDASDPFLETICLWATIEALSPQRQAPRRCQKCQAELSCSCCGDTQDGLQVLAGIREGIARVESLSNRAVGDLYRFRSRLIHGQHEPTYATYEEAAEHVETVRPIAQAMLWFELDQTGIEYAQQPVHLTFNLDCVLSCSWHEGVYESPAPLYRDMQWGIGTPGEHPSEWHPIG